MNPAGDFEIINVLNPTSKSDLFLVKRITGEEFFVWRTILFKTMSKDKRDLLCKRIRSRIQQSHVLLVKFYPAIEEDRLKLVYVPMEYFPQGSLLDFLKILAKSETTHIPEEVLVKFLFQLVILVKSVEINDALKLGNIYFDEQFNIKFLNFSHSTSQIKNEVKMCDIGIIIMHLCTLTVDRMSNKFTVKRNHYSEDFINLIESMLKDNSPAILNIDKIITNPVILLNTFKLNCGISLNGCFELLDYRRKLEQLRKKESSLQLRESNIERKEYNVIMREKKLVINEKAVKDKLIQAELYLKRCKENKTSQCNKYENVDTSLNVEYEEIEEIDVIETSKKLDIEKFKNHPIARTLSERKIKFKGHSPLKKMSFNKSKSNKKKEKQIKSTKDSKSSIKPENNSNTNKDIKTSATRKCDFGEKENVTVPDMGCRPITWTEENKKHAFEMLRIMNINSDKQFQNSEVLHTFL